MVILLVCFAMNQLATADGIWIKEETEPRFGRILRQDSETVVFQPFGTSEKNEWDRSKIEVLVVNFDSDRLESLSLAKLSEYRDYAEELAAQKRDLVARELAVRLFLIAAFHASGDLRESSFVGLIDLAENEQQRQRWTTLRWLVTGRGELPTGDGEDRVHAAENEATQTILNLVRAIRRGQKLDAVKWLNQPNLESMLMPWSTIVSVDELDSMARSTKLTASQLHRLVKIELSIVTNDSLSDSAEDRKTDWSEDAWAKASPDAELPSFKNITPFDPQKSTYRSGLWVKPE